VPDYSISDAPPPPPSTTPAPAGTRRSKLLRNLIEVAEKHPGKPRLVVRYDSPETARVLAAKLRAGERAINGRPPGTWEFTHGPVIVKNKPTGTHGVWATFTPPAPAE
jgi:hypothetical protein